MKKYMFCVFVMVFPLASFSAESEDSGLSSAQKWVLGLTGGALLATSAATHQNYAQDPRKIIVLLGLATFAGVTIYEDSKKSEKIVFRLEGSQPSIAFVKTF